MKAMIFAAGLGLRLKPLTDIQPKCLVEVNGRTMLEHVIDRLKMVDVDAVIINIHHFARQIHSFVKQKNSFGLQVEFSYEEELLETGGGLKKASWFFKSDSAAQDEEPFFVHNSDVYSDIDLKAMLDFHRSHRAVATLAVNRHKTSRYLRFDTNQRLVGRENQKTGQEVLLTPGIEFERLSFTGIHVLSPKIFDYMQDQSGRFSIIDTYMKAIQEGALIIGYRADDSFWMDMGSVERLESLRQKLKSDKKM